MDLFEKVAEALKNVRSRPTRVPTTLVLPQEESQSSGAPRIKRNREYFAVWLNELFLSQSGRWWVEFDPMVFVATEFEYDKSRIVVPFVVGPALIAKATKDEVPKGMVIRNTRVAGPYPFRGSTVALTVMLYQVKRTDYSRKLLQVVEGVSGALDFASSLGSFNKVAASVMDGVEVLLGLGDTQAVMGQRTEFDSSDFSRNNRAILNSQAFPEAGKAFGVTDKRLVYGAAGSAGSDFRDSDYVLYSIHGDADRDDDRELPFYRLYEAALTAALGGTEEDWKRAKSTLLTLYQSMVLSADLTRDQADRLFDAYQADILAAKAKAERVRDLAATQTLVNREALQAPAAPLLPAKTVDGILNL